MSDSEEKPRRRSRKRVEEESLPEWVEEVFEPPAKSSRVRLKPPSIQPEEPEAPPEPKPARKRASKKPAEQALPPVDPPAEPIRSPLIGWIPVIGKAPRLEVKAGKAAREIKQETAKQPLTFWTLMVRLLPMWALLIMILILEPALPFRAVGAVVNWGLSQMPTRPTQPAAEPIYIVEGSGEAAPQTQLPPPNWPLQISPLFVPSVQYWKEQIAEWSVTYRIKPNMIATIMQIESCGDPNALSPLGAVGLFQVMPLHFEAGEEPTNPATNAKRGLLYLGQMLASANGDPGLTFAAYNGGPSMLFTSPADWPAETQDYQFWASGIHEDAELGFDVSPTLEDWLDRGGGSLCAQAESALGIGP